MVHTCLTIDISRFALKDLTYITIYDILIGIYELRLQGIHIRDSLPKYPGTIENLTLAIW